MNPYLLMSLFYLSLAVAATVGSSLVTFDLLPAASALRWLRVHFITLGTVTQMLFGVLPVLAAAKAGRPRPSVRWSVWLVFNTGLLALLIGIPTANRFMMIMGGSLILAATLLLLRQLLQESGLGNRRLTHGRWSGGTRFYIAGLSYLLLGAFIGTGLYLGWGAWLHLPAPKEVHVHSNLWGYAALVFAGLLVDLPICGAKGCRSLLDSRRLNAIFLLMVSGAFGMALGPWIENTVIESGGLILHTVGTVWLLAGIVRDLRAARDRGVWTAGRLHILTGFAWFLVAAAMGPIVVFLPQGSVARSLASQGGPLLIYGWLMQFGLAILPYLFGRALAPQKAAAFGGNTISLVAANLGAVLYLAGLLIPGFGTILQGVAFLSW
ncbi:MAG: hypothetical protein ACM3JD_14005, partial [Rudaea sp.]